MKKYTILLSDDEDDNIYTKDSFVHPSINLPKVQATPITEVKLSSNSRMNNISQEISDVSHSQKYDVLNRIKNEYNGSVRSPIPKSDDEILFWVATSRPPCLYRLYDETLNSHKSENIQELGYHQLSSNCVSSNAFIGTHSDIKYNKKLSLYKTCGSTDSSIEKEQLLHSKPLSSFKDVHYNDSKNNKNIMSLREDAVNAIGQSHFINGSTHKIDLKCSIEKEPSGFNIMDKPFESKLNVGGNICGNLSNTNVENHKIFKQDHSRSHKSLNAYDSDSSVLTINYIQYVNKAKVNKKSKSFSVKRRNDLISPRTQYSPHNLKPKVTRSKMSLLKSRSLDVNGKLGQFKSRSPLKSDNNSSNVLDYQPQDAVKEHKVSLKKKQLFKQSYADMKRKNEKVFDTSKTSSSSIENNFDNKHRQFKKTSQKVLSDADNTKYYPLSKIPNKTCCSDYGSSTSSCNVNILKSSRKQNIVMSYTKVETRVVSVSVLNSNAYSTVINYPKQSTSFLPDSV